MGTREGGGRVTLIARIIRSRVVTFLETNTLIIDAQHGFRNWRSCLTNLLTFFNDVYSRRPNPSDEVHPDIQKAFDKVTHTTLFT